MAENSYKRFGLVPMGRDYVWAQLDKDTVAAAVAEAAAVADNSTAAAARSAHLELPADNQCCQRPEIAVRLENYQSTPSCPCAGAL